MIRSSVVVLGSVLLLLAGCSGKAESTSAPSGGSAGESSGGASAGSGAGGGSAGSAGSGGATCTEGQTMSAGCNDCRCLAGQWACTLIACNTVCGGEIGSTCQPNEYCAYTAGQSCGAADATAMCQPRPTACDDIYAPVCGCDQKTYPSSCDAAMHGQGVYANGACAGDADAGVACGARAGDTCAADQYCAYTAGSACGAADAEARCAPRPTICGKNYQPVCGCDQKSYSNVCEAAMHGQGVYAEGSCGNSISE